MSLAKGSLVASTAVNLTADIASVLWRSFTPCYHSSEMNTCSGDHHLFPDWMLFLGILCFTVHLSREVQILSLKDSWGKWYFSLIEIQRGTKHWTKTPQKLQKK